MSKIYLPDEITSTQCAVMVSNGVLRVYSVKPNGTTINNVVYHDYYLQNDYIRTSGSTNFNTYTNYNCIDYNMFTNDYWYRLDFANIIIILTFFIILFIILPFKLFTRFFGRWLKL